MSIRKHIEGHPEVVRRAASKASVDERAERDPWLACPTDPEDAARQRRFSRMLQAEGLWKNRTDIANDGVIYQEEMRAD